MAWSGTKDIERAAEVLARRLPAPLAPLARVAFNYRWSWTPGGSEVFAAIDPDRWRLYRENPVRLLHGAASGAMERAASDTALTERAEALAATLDADLARPPLHSDHVTVERPVAFLCAEFGLHGSLPIYSGGLGVLAGDILKEASDLALPMVGVGLLYRRGYFHQRVDSSGWQHEYWVELDVERIPGARVTGDDGRPLTVAVPLWGREVAVEIWRVDVGRVPLFLLDTDLRENSPIDRFVTGRLYEGNREVRMAQYAVLGIGGVRALRALGIDPSVLHLNEGHAAWAALELAAELVADGLGFEAACEAARERVVFTTHTPVPAGNEAYRADELVPVLGNLPDRLATDWEGVMRLARVHPDESQEPAGMTSLAIRMSRGVNGVSRRHGEVAREMWHELYPGCAAEDVPIRHITNGVHLPTWIAPAMRALLDHYLGADWTQRADDPATWEAIDRIPDEELWAVRCELRRGLVDFVRARTVTDRLTRGEPLDYVESAARSFDAGSLTVGFARRLATYKRLHLLTLDSERVLRLLDGPNAIQCLIAGKAHPKDDEGKRVVHSLFGLKRAPRGAERVVFLEDYDLPVGRALTSGCDVWINVPRPPLEASGTSGMKSALNGGLNLSVLDGWWAEAYDGRNGWAIDGDPDPDHDGQDARHAAALYDLLEREVVPLFHERDEGGIPRGWVARTKASLKTNGPRFCATRMVGDYLAAVYPP